jgi:hypothetical protein
VRAEGTRNQYRRLKLPDQLVRLPPGDLQELVVADVRDFQRLVEAELTAAGEVEPTLFDELLALESLFHGAFLAANRQLGLDSDARAQVGTAPEADAAQFLKWSANLEHDADLSQDARMMVPVFFDQQRRQTKVWVVLGWTGRQVCISFARPPSIQAFNRDGALLDSGKYDLHFGTNCTRLAYPVMAEVYVNEILDREQFRRHCDTYKTRSAILVNLK